MTAACKSTAGGDADSSPPKDKAAATLAGGPESDTKPCGTPPCTRYVSRSETRTLNSTIAEHPIISTVVLHLAGTVLCGGLLCLLGETVSLVYVGRQAKTAADNHECLRVRILPDGHELRLVDVAPSNQAPYCKD